MTHLKSFLVSGASVLALAQVAAAQELRERAQDMFAPLPSTIASLNSAGDAPGSPAAVAAFGGVERPKLTISEVAESMKEPLAAPG